MSHTITITINGQSTPIGTGTSVAAAILGTGNSTLRRSVTGQPRGPLCGMGVCFECRVTIDGLPHQRSCQLLCRDGMEIVTDG